jgi:hypothetical protein
MDSRGCRRHNQHHLNFAGARALQFDTWWIVAFLLAIAWLVPTIGNRYFAAVENLFSRLALHRKSCVIGLFFATIVIRLLLLPILPYPRPSVHDEFSYLTQADIFAHGRLSFPSHPMSRFFETFYVTFYPTYSSIFPPAQAAFLAFGQLLGSPWIGVLVSTATMVAAFLWMLQAWVPPRWALLGAVVLLLRFAIFGYWMNSYWGGSIAAAAAALVLGSLPRLFRKQHPRDALILGIGIAILANSRPLEGFIFSVPVAVLLIVWSVRKWKQGSSVQILRLLPAISACLLATLIFILFYDWRVTGDPLTVPHAVFYKQLMSVPIFLWGKILPPLHYANPQFENLYNVWVRGHYDGTLRAAANIESDKISDFWRFYLGCALSLPFLFLGAIITNRRIRFLLLLVLFCSVGLLSVTWFLPHYAAPMFSALAILLVQSLRQLRKWKSKGRPVGVGWTRVVVLVAVLLALTNGVYQLHDPSVAHCLLCQYNWDRANIVSRLSQTPGQHLVIVRYSSTHNAHFEWVYNSADIDSSEIVWAREIPGVDLAPLLAYYRGRKAWLVEPDMVPPRLSPYVRESHIVEPR